MTVTNYWDPPTPMLSYNSNTTFNWGGEGAVNSLFTAGPVKPAYLMLKLSWKWMWGLKPRETKPPFLNLVHSFGIIADIDVLEVTSKKFDKHIAMADEQIQTTMKKWKLPMLQLSDKAREIHLLPGVWNILQSVSQFANEGYMTIFYPLMV